MTAARTRFVAHAELFGDLGIRAALSHQSEDVQFLPGAVLEWRVGLAPADQSRNDLRIDCASRVQQTEPTGVGCTWQPGHKL